MLKSFYQRNILEAGTDEAGRGCLAGPVFAAAVILPENFHEPLLNDSKLLSPKLRNDLKQIIEKKALSFAVAMVDNHTIDKINILKASFKAMNEAIKTLSIVPEFILVDGNRFYPETNIPFKCFVKGDATYASIAAASVLAKTYRDEYMLALHEKFLVYNFAKNKGYPTEEHRTAIMKHGITEYHRKSFRLLNQEKQLKFDFNK